MKIKTRGIKLATLSSMSIEEREHTINKLIEQVLHPSSSQIEEQRKEIEEQIKAYERRYEISSVKLKSDLANGMIKETADICSWLMLLKQRNLVERV